MPELRYHRMGNLVELKINGMTNHEIRTVLLGLWLRLDRDDREDFILELSHYLSPESVPPPLALVIAKGELQP